MAGTLVSVLVRLLLITVTDGAPVLLYEKYPALYLIIPMTAFVLLGAVVYGFRIYQDMAVLQVERAFEDFLDKNNVDGDIFIVFGDFYKLPGFSSGGESCPYETGSDAGVVQIPYQSQTNDWMVTLFKIL